MEKKRSRGNIVPSCSGMWRRAKQRAETFEFRENHSAFYHLAKHCFVDQNEFRHAVARKGIAINSTSDVLNRALISQLKQAVEGKFMPPVIFVPNILVRIFFLLCHFV